MLLSGDEPRIDVPQFRVKEVGQTGTMARHSTQNGQNHCDGHSPFKSTVHKGCDCPCSMTITRIGRRRTRVPYGPPVALPRPGLLHSCGALGCWLQRREAVGLRQLHNVSTSQPHSPTTYCFTT